jgi:ectoine hydroxylase-related dioxygenase (phytanoyl-CoA dioxygenase family)
MSQARSPHPVAIANPDETGSLGIIYLKRFWSRTIAARVQPVPGPRTSRDLVAENVLLAGLKLGVRETLDFLMKTTPSFEEFEAWVLAKNGGIIEAARVERLNRALRGEPLSALESIQKKPVLSAAELGFWDEHGYVVVKEAVSAEHCRAAVQAIFEHTGMELSRPESWYKDNLWILLAHHPALWANRNSPRIHTAFAQLWKRNDLWMNVDVCGVNPPERPGYQFRGSPLHWDMSLTPPVRFGTQAILYLTDTATNQGAFSCVPGFHRRLENWLRELPTGIDPRAQAQKELQAIPIAGEAGDLIIWHQALPHCATPNHAGLPRVVQYLNMFPSQYEVNAEWS